MNLRKKIYTDFNEELEIIWKKFEENSNNFCFQNFHWLKNWYSNLNQENKPKIYNVLVYHNAELIMILPLCVNTINKKKYLTWQGGGTADYMCCLLGKKFFLEKKIFLKLWSEIQNEIKFFDIIHFFRQPKKINELYNPFVIYLFNNKEGYSSSISLEKDFDSFLKKIKKKFINDTARSVKNLKKIGDLEFEIYKDFQKENILPKLQLLLKNKIKRLEEKKIKNFFNTKSFKFYENFDKKYYENGFLHFSSLSIKKKNISLHWGVVYKKTFYYLLPSILDTSFFKYSPGRIHLLELIKWSINNNIQKFDFTIGDENYKKNWTNREELLYTHIKINNLRASNAYIFIYLKIILKKINFIKHIYKNIKNII